MRIRILTTAFLLIAMTSAWANDVTLSSPDGQMQVTIHGKKDGLTWEVSRCGTPVNADRNGNDYRHTGMTINLSQPLKIHLAPGGGWNAVIDM